MTRYNTLIVNLSNSQLNKIKSGIKNGTEVTLNFSLNVVGDSNNETDFPHKLLLTNTQVSNLRKDFANNLSANKKYLKLNCIQQDNQEIFLGKPLRPLLKTGLTLRKNVFKPLAKSVLIPLGLKTSASAIDGVIHKKIFSIRYASF